MGLGVHEEVGTVIGALLDLRVISLAFRAFVDVVLLVPDPFGVKTTNLLLEVLILTLFQLHQKLYYLLYFSFVIGAQGIFDAEFGPIVVFIMKSHFHEVLDDIWIKKIIYLDIFIDPVVFCLHFRSPGCSCIIQEHW